MRNIGRRSDLKLRKSQFDDLVRMVSCAKTKEETTSVLQTLLMYSEKDNISQRASMLGMFLEGKSFVDVQDKCGASSSTVTRAFDQYLKNGDKNKSFKEVVSRANKIKEEEEKNEEKVYSNEYSKGPSVMGIIREDRRSNKHTRKVNSQRETENTER